MAGLIVLIIVAFFLYSVLGHPSPVETIDSYQPPPEITHEVIKDVTPGSGGLDSVFPIRSKMVVQKMQE